ncbi:MAG: hypothetical protein Q8P62_03150 [Candidatus Peregrinibacteria bacterium]|nr:hypothetical protein [Candidatus Peregrinibacteria bacterium]
MMKFFVEKKGLVLTEALMTISILVTCAVIAGGMFTNAVNTTAVSKDFLIANGLAIEGAEAVKNIVYTNKLLSPNEPECWLRLNPDDENCVAIADSTNYLPEQKDGDQKRGKWKLSGQIATDLDLSEGIEKNASYLLYLNNETGLYQTSSNGAVASKFYRSVKFSHVDNVYATFEVQVAWFEGAKAWNTKSVVDIINQ